MENRDTKYSDAIRVALELLRQKQSLDSWDRALTEQLLTTFNDKNDIKRN